MKKLISALLTGWILLQATPEAANAQAKKDNSISESKNPAFASLPGVTSEPAGIVALKSANVIAKAQKDFTKTFSKAQDV